MNNLPVNEIIQQILAIIGEIVKWILSLFVKLDLTQIIKDLAAVLIKILQFFISLIQMVISKL